MGGGSWKGVLDTRYEVLISSDYCYPLIITTPMVTKHA